MKKLWKKFAGLADLCYGDMILAQSGMEHWDQAFSVLLEIVKTGREQDGSFARELYQLDDSTDFQYNIGGWLEDYLGELDIRDMHEKICEVCRTLIDLFEWKEDSPSELRYYIASAMKAQGNDEEMLAFCENWHKEEKDNVLAAAALIYARTETGNFEGAEQLVKEYLTEETVCTEDNDIIYTAAARLYELNGNKKAEQQMKQALKKYQEEMDEIISSLDSGGQAWDVDDEGFPFN